MLKKNKIRKEEDAKMVVHEEKYVVEIIRDIK